MHTATMDMTDLQSAARDATRLLKALGNPTRLSILCELVEGERSVGALERTTSLTQSAVSQHLARLRRDGLVVGRREAQTIYYSLAGAEVEAMLATLHGLYCGKSCPAQGDGSRCRSAAAPPLRA